ncbi:MAG: thrombospondin type 3 repeat-containing protein, partial [Desulfocapsa sp.]|nr:thrombospondin type 3 repeat-containing protein [Desulfocapsa sp.]
VIENGNNTLLVSAHQIAYDEPLNGAMALFLFPTNMLPDTDNDGVVDSMDNCPFDADNDMDDDGICGDEDNCPADANVDQANFDDDVFGNVCDADDDNDGFDDEFDNCQYDNNPSQSDIDIDGIGDVCDSDIDGDNVIDAIDECIDTTFGDVVNETGCSIQQICPCDNNWKNHGGYMKCVAHTSEYFLDYGLITFDEKDIIVSSEAKTKCGSKK